MQQQWFQSLTAPSKEPHKHKIQLCRSFAEQGYCIYAEQCMFAHGLEQLLVHQPHLKLKKCRNYHTDGHCRFGERCNFRHEKQVKQRKKKNMFTFHRILTSYPELVMDTLCVRADRCGSESSSECSYQ